MTESDNKEHSGHPEKTRTWEPKVYSALAKEQHYFAGHDINIREALDSYGAIIWPAAVALCHFLENNHQQFDLMDKAVLEIGAGTGLLSIVASLLGAWVTATDVPDVLGNLKCNLMRNTRGRCRYTPQVAALCWEDDLERTYPRSVYRYDYVLAADVVYHHDFLDELLVTMRHFCQPGTTLLWANKIRFQSDLRFTSSFMNTFHTTLLAELPKEEIKIFMATCKD
ncbi:protein-lysine methyltransferase METTL21C [Megalops cyprinoides]|uniref:protein-lysine methyltransferase METTL21C n=1 Tax=Megalops cyprinoides TaxID=118141 RepID=UPI0018641EB8|nr:protein-lysine methyltransferase METTL21C [Megalops cyprinoides]